MCPLCDVKIKKRRDTLNSTRGFGPGGISLQTKRQAKTKEGYSTVNFSVICIFLYYMYSLVHHCVHPMHDYSLSTRSRSLFSSSISDFYSTFSLPGGDDEFDAFYFSRSYLAYASSLSRFLKISSRDMNGCGYFDFCSLILGKSTVCQYAWHCSQECLTPRQPATVSQHIFSLSSCCSTAEVNEVS